MVVKHRISISVSDPKRGNAQVLRGAVMKLPTRLVRFLFGDFTQIYLLAPGQSVEAVDIHEIKEGGCSCGKG